MVTEVVVMPALSKEMILAGKDLAAELDESDLNATALMWLFDPEVGTWRFVVSSPDVKTRGPRWVYKKIQSALMKRPDIRDNIQLSDTSAVAEDDVKIVTLKRTVRKIEKSEVRGNRTTGIGIYDVYIYRLI